MFAMNCLKSASLALALGVTLSAQVPEGYRIMTPWPYGNGERVGVYGNLFKKGDYQRCEMKSFTVGDSIRATRLGSDYWVEFRYADGTSQKVLYEYSKPGGAHLESEPPSDFLGSWKADFIARQELVGYRIFWRFQFFAEQFIQPDPNPPSVRVWEPAPGRIAWDIQGRVDNFETSVLFSRDFAEHWWGVGGGIGDLHGDYVFKEFNLKDAKHSLLIRVETIQDFRRFVMYYQLGKGYVSSPEEIGSPKGRK